MIDRTIANALLACVVAAAATTFAQTYPTKPIRVIIPSAAGGGADIVARTIGQKLTEVWGQQIVIDNRVGVVGIIGAARAVPDGYTVLLTVSGIVLREAIYEKMPYQTLRDFLPVSQVIAQSNVLVVHPVVPARSVQELIALAKARPGQLNYGSGGSGTSNHLAGELLKVLAKINVVHIPYKGVPAATNDLLGGHLHFLFGSPVSTLPHVKSGRLRLLAVTTAKRSAGLPEVPTVAESGVPGFEFTGWMGVLVPAGTPREIVRKLHQEISRIVQLAEVKQRFAADAAETVGSTPEEFGDYLKAELTRWTQVAIQADIRMVE